MDTLVDSCCISLSRVPFAWIPPSSGNPLYEVQGKPVLPNSSMLVHPWGWWGRTHKQVLANGVLHPWPHNNRDWLGDGAVGIPSLDVWENRWPFWALGIMSCKDHVSLGPPVPPLERDCLNMKATQNKDMRSETNPEVIIWALSPIVSLTWDTPHPWVRRQTKCLKFTICWLFTPVK